MTKTRRSNLLQFSLFDSTALNAPTGGPSPLLDQIPVQEPPPPPKAQPARNYRLASDRTLAPTWKGRAADNLAAIRLLQEIQAADRPATHEEQERLSRFTGFGASELANTLFRRAGEDFRQGWGELGAELEAMVTPAELAGLARATQYAHYTPEFIVRAMWSTLTRMGFAGGTILEPGCGTGLFMSLMPESLASKTSLTGIEADPITARIADRLFPDAWIRHEDFTKARIPETFDLVIGNPPFSDRTVRAADPSGKLGLSLHDYFIARSVERLKPGGVAAFVTSRWTMDKTSSGAREHLADMADLIGAVRLPQAAMQEAAGTEVVVDILFLQKRRPGQSPSSAAWDTVAEAVPAQDGEDTLSINRYFIDHPEMVLGEHGRTSSPFGPTYTCRARLGVELTAALDQALGLVSTGARIPVSESVQAGRPKAARIVVGTAADGATVKEGSYALIGLDLVQIIDGVPTPVLVRSATRKEGVFAKHERIIRGLIPIRDAVRCVLRAQEANEPWGQAQIRLRSAYQSFVRQFGPINHARITTRTDEETGEVSETVRRPNLAPFIDDPDCWLVASIEDYDEDSDTAKTGPIFTQRVIHPPAEPAINSAADALAVVLHEVGYVDIDCTAELLGRSRAEVLAELGDAVFLNPALTTEGLEVWETADAYLSGSVRTKLAVAEASAALDERYVRNAAALRAVQPEDLKPSDITARLGAPWMPAEVVEAFVAERIGVEVRIRHTVEIASWSFNVHAFEGLAAATSEWGTQRRHAGYLLDDALNAVIPQIYDVWTEDGVEKRKLNAADTEAAKEKLAKIKTVFEQWVWLDPDRADRLSRIYNDRFNNLVPRAFNGDHLQLPGASSNITMRRHQKRVVWRIIADGTTYIAHAVGSGKTFSMAAAVMEQRRLGLVGKPLVLGIIRNELCMDLVNLASATAGTAPLIPTPGVTSISDNSGGYLSVRYAMSNGNASGTPICGAITMRQPNTTPTTIAGIRVDMAAVQSAVFTSVLSGSIRPGVAKVAEQLWQTKKPDALTGLNDVYTAAVQRYTSALTAAATSVQSNINSALASNATQARQGALDLQAGAVQQSTLGWTSAGAYYLSISRANAATLSLLSGLPMASKPTYQGMPRSLVADLTPMQVVTDSFLATLQTVVNSQDGITQPTGAPLTLAAAQDADSMGTLAKVMSVMNFNGNTINKILNLFNQTTADAWSDPFGRLIQLGQTLIILSLSGMVLAAAASSDVGSIAIVAGGFATGGIGGAIAAVGLSTVINYLAFPVFMLLLAMLTPGVIISYVLPLIPYTLWIAGVTGWIILVCEAMIAVPLWMLAHMTLGGDGLHGRAVEGWGMLFNVMFRPVLMVLGLFLSFFVFTSVTWLIRQSFGIAANFALSGGNIVTNFLGLIVMLNIFVMTEVAAAFMSFRMIALLPHHLPRLLGFTGASRVDMDAFAERAANIVGGQTAAGMQRTLSMAATNAGKDGKRIGRRTRRLQSPSSSMDSTECAITEM